MKIIKFKIFALAILATACNPKENPETQVGEHEEEGHGHGEEDLELTKIQMENAGIRLGTFQYQEIGEAIEANGSIELPPNNIASISPVVGGFVQKINFLEGDVVKQGEALVELKNPAYIRLQQDFLKAQSRFGFLEQELARQTTLNEAEIGAKKHLQQTQSDYNSTKAELAAAREQLNYLGINVAALKEGRVQNTVYLRAPFSGTVTTVNAHRGEMVEAGQEIMEVINRDHMHLELQVFQRDIPKIKKGQKIRFSIPAFENGKAYTGEVSLVGKNLDMKTKTIRVHGHFEEEEVLLPGLYVEASISQASAKSRVLPEEAVIRDEGKQYFFVKKGSEGEQVLFEKVAFEPGATAGGFVEIKDFATGVDTASIVVEGAFYLKSEMNKTEGGHGH